MWVAIFLSCVQAGAPSSPPPPPPRQCRFGGATPGTDTSDGHLGCAVLVPHLGVGSVSVELNATDTEAAYVDAQLVAYSDRWLGGGTTAVISVIAIGADGTSNFSTAIEYLTAAGLQGADMVRVPPPPPLSLSLSLPPPQAHILMSPPPPTHAHQQAVLPEQFRGAPGLGKVGGTSWPAEPLDGPTITAVAAVARQHGMYVVAPIRELVTMQVNAIPNPTPNPSNPNHETMQANLSSNQHQLPHPHQPQRQHPQQTTVTREYNSAVVIGRDGAIVGVYRKMFPVIGPPPPRGPLGPGAEAGVTPGMDGVPVFQLDFGRVAVLTCEC
jgi:hypothetical protein